MFNKNHENFDNDATKRKETKKRTKELNKVHEKI